MNEAPTAKISILEISIKNWVSLPNFMKICTVVSKLFVFESALLDFKLSKSVFKDQISWNMEWQNEPIFNLNLIQCYPWKPFDLSYSLIISSYTDKQTEY